MRWVFTSVLAIVVALGVGFALSVRTRAKMEQEAVETTLIDGAGLLLEFAAALRSNEQAREVKLTDLEGDRLQYLLQGLWSLRHKSRQAFNMAVAVHEYLRKWNVPLNENILTDPNLRKPNLSQYD